MNYYTVYKTTNKINGRFYHGAHQTNDLDDDYMGSGTYLKRAIKKYGKENFEKEILCLCETVEEMFDMKSQVVKMDDPLSYNLRTGGYGGWECSEETKRKMSIAKLGENHPLFGKTGENSPNFGKHYRKIQIPMITETIG